MRKLGLSIGLLIVGLGTSGGVLWQHLSPPPAAKEIVAEPEIEHVDGPRTIEEEPTAVPATLPPPAISNASAEAAPIPPAEPTMTPDAPPASFLSAPTTDLDEIIRLLEMLATRETELLEAMPYGWHHRADVFYSPAAGELGLELEGEVGQRLALERLPTLPVSESYMRLAAADAPAAGISMQRDLASGIYYNISIYEAGGWINISFRDNGQPESIYKTVKELELISTTQTRAGAYKAGVVDADTEYLAEQVGDILRITMLDRVAPDANVHGAGGPVAQAEVVEEYDIQTGQFLYSHAVLTLVDGRRLLVSQTWLEAQDVVAELPLEVQLLYPQHGFSLP